ncbi:FAD-dependent oxidoreductase [Dickeya poaceiphila]|uniref:FAD-binding protein n=1 Tax=Dickeya poaceiphila TaxID=568768 RepID=A0A5B8IA32_9GAMM|nr:FAD-dependent monooxygenase [Dickeya poaceiphila]QDX31013.1 FAD-binding protein [Dickeya poaceiphila]
MTQHTCSANKAVVIGASIAGCLTASVLSRHFQQVILLDFDRFHENPEPRQTVPQEHHVHLLLQRGLQIMESLYPGLKSQLLEAGAQEIDLSHGVKSYAGVGWKQRWPTGITAHYCSRTLLEHVIRRRAIQLANVSVLDGTRVKQLIHEDGKVKGVIVSESGNDQQILADLVVDASGRGSKASSWLKQAGYGEVEREEVANQLGYVSRVYKRDNTRQTGWKVLLVTPNLPKTRTMAVISPVEGDRYIVTAGGWFGDSPKPNEADFMRFLAELPVTDIHDEVQKLEPLGDFHQFKMPSSLRRRYDLLPTWPEGFLVIGDALCSINPIYSQGMSVSALQIEALAQQIPGYLNGTLSARLVFKKLVAATAVSWELAKKSDESLQPTEAITTFKHRLTSHYLNLVQAASFHRRDVAITMLKIMNLLEKQESVFRLPIVLASLSSAIARTIR